VQGDLDRTHGWLHRDDISRAIGVRTPFTKEQQLRWFEDLSAATNKVVFAICEVGSGGHIGNVSLDTIDQRHKTARLSIFLAESGDRGQGLGTRALNLLCHYAFETLGLRRLYCKTNAGESKVLRFYERVGFRVEGTMREHELIDGEYRDKVMLGLLRSEWIELDVATSCEPSL
jgi:RimJ/RimL family protein N-acetyltransferase